MSSRILQRSVHRPWWLVRAPVRRRSSTSASFQYLSPLERYQTEKPYYINIPPDGIPGFRHTNEESSLYDQIPVLDIRDRREPARLDREGFEHISGVDRLAGALEYKSYEDPEKIVRHYGPAVESWIRDHLGAESVYTFGFRVRRRDAQFPALYRGTKPGVGQPIQGVHSDFTPDYARTTATYVGRFEDDLSLPNRRWQLISVWRPLFGPLLDWPLGLLDFTSIRPERDLIAADNVYPHQVSETYHVLHHQEHRWYFLSDQQPNEVLMFKAFDSARKRTGVARLCPHAAFKNPTTPQDVRPRESIECVSLVLYPKGSAIEEDAAELLPSETPSHLPPTGAFSFA